MLQQHDNDDDDGGDDTQREKVSFQRQKEVYDLAGCPYSNPRTTSIVSPNSHR